MDCSDYIEGYEWTPEFVSSSRCVAEMKTSPGAILGRMRSDSVNFSYIREGTPTAHLSQAVNVSRDAIRLQLSFGEPAVPDVPSGLSI